MSKSSRVSLVETRNVATQATPVSLAFDCWWEYDELLQGIKAKETVDGPDVRSVYIAVPIFDDLPGPLNVSGSFDFLAANEFAHLTQEGLAASLEEATADFMSLGNYTEVYWEYNASGTLGYSSSWDVGLGDEGYAYWSIDSRSLDATASIYMECGSDNGQYIGWFMGQRFDLVIEEDRALIRFSVPGHFWQVLVDASGANVTSG